MPTNPVTPLVANPHAVWQLSDYACLSTHFDEMCAAPNQPREHWRYLVDALQRMGWSELQSRQRESYRLLRESGVTYSLDSDKAERPWQLDPIPLLMSSSDWLTIERGIAQRLELLNALLKDIYGRGEVFRKNLLPPELIYDYPGFQRACTSVPTPGGQFLHFYAADLARAPDGSFYLVGDRTQAPPGAGYALENRIVLSRVLPSLFRDAHVHRLALFFRSLRHMLHNLAWRRHDDARIVVLTQGAGTPNYFEHAYLAKYLGYTLVQGADLTVRNGHVWLKTLDGLQPVDVILNCMAGALSDPLELDPSSIYGVAGLLQAVRLRQVVVINTTSTGVLEHRGLMQFMPQLAQHFLGEDLLLPSPPTLWCGRPHECEYVLANLKTLLIKNVQPLSGEAAIHGETLNNIQLESLRQRILARPHMYVGQQQVTRSQTPVFVGDRLEPRQMVLRTFALRSETDVLVMPGGLTRVAPAFEQMVISDQDGGLTKDTWVLASEPESQVSLLPATDSVSHFVVGRGELPSRVAENLFWLGRYAERGESITRLLRTLLRYLTEPPEQLETDNSSLHSLLRALTAMTETYPGFIGEGSEACLQAPEDELMSVFLDAQRAGSLAFVLNALLFAARAVRERLSPDIWRVFNEVEDKLTALSQRQTQLSGLHSFFTDTSSDILYPALDSLNQLVTIFAAFNGLSQENMTQGQGWQFLIIGRRLERAQLTTYLLRATLCGVPAQHQVTSHEPLLLEQLLLICDSLMTYRSRYRTQISIVPTLDLLLQDETNPRALSYQLERLQYYISNLPRDNVFAYKSQEERLLLEALTQVRLADPQVLSAHAEHGGDSATQRVGRGAFRAQLDQLLVRLNHLLPAISDALTNSYFSHTETPHQLVPFENDNEQVEAQA